MQASRNFASASQRSAPHSSQLRRAPGPAPVYPPQAPNHAPQLTPQQQAAKYAEEERRREAHRRLARKPTDRDIPAELADVCIGDGVERYRKMRDVERRLDSVMMQKRLQVTESVPSTTPTREGTLRIWISNTAEGQPWQVLEEGGAGFGDDGTFDFGENSQATYRVKIEGKLILDPEDDDDNDDEDDAMEQDSPEAAKKRQNKRSMLSHFFKSINIDFDRPASLQADGFTTIEWKKPERGSNASDSAANFDCLEFERKSDEDINVTICLTRDESPERFRLSPALAELLDTEENDRAGVLAGVWDYVRYNGLQEDEENRRVVCDERLRAVFNSETIFLPFVPEQVLPHLTPVPPIRLPYTIRVDKDYISPSDGTTKPSAPTIYDIRVPLSSTVGEQMSAIQNSPSHIENLKAITRLDEDLAIIIAKINHTNAKRKFYDSLSHDPTNFIKRWISSQQRDLEVILAEAGRGFGEEGYLGEEFRRGGKDSVWGGDLARESVGLFLARQKTTH